MYKICSINGELFPGLKAATLGLRKALARQSALELKGWIKKKLLR